MKKRILLLLSERSTYTSLVAMLGSSLALGLNEEAWQQVSAAVAAVAGLIGMLTLDNGDREKLEAEEIEETE